MSHSRFEYVKQYEQHFDLLKNTYIAIRIDGKGFTKFCESHSFKKPNDINQIKLMLIAALNVMKNYSEIFISYGQSDEFSFILKRSTQIYYQLLLHHMFIIGIKYLKILNYNILRLLMQE